MIWLLYMGGGLLGLGILGQLYAWIRDRPNPVLEICVDILGCVGDVIGGMDFGGGDGGCDGGGGD